MTRDQLKTLWLGIYEGLVLAAFLAFVYVMFGVFIPALTQ